MSGTPFGPQILARGRTRYVEHIVLCDCPMGPGARCGAWGCARFGCDCPPPFERWCEHGYAEFAMERAAEVQQKTPDTADTPRVPCPGCDTVCDDCPLGLHA